MILLLLVTLTGLATVILSVASLFLSSRFSSLSWTARLILMFGPAVDAILGLYVLDWMGLSSLNAVMGGILFGIFSLTFLQPFFMPQRLVVWRLAKENIRRRKRQSVLMVAGLIIASAIITSSLVVGDSLDATVAYEVEASYGATDVLISGLDPQTGAGVQFSTEVARSVWQGIEQDDVLSSQVIGRQYGVANGVSLTSEEGLAEPSVSWFARDASVDALEVWQPLDVTTGMRFQDLAAANDGALTPQVVVNQVASERLEIKAGDILEMGWFVTDDGQRVKRQADVQVHAVVANEGQGAMAGTRSPAVFADLSTAQTLLEAPGVLNRMSLALVDDLDDGAVEQATERIEELFNQRLTADDVGMNLTSDEGTGAITISTTAGFGRIAGEDVQALRENASILMPETTMMEVLQVPLIDVVTDEEPLLTLADGDVTELYSSGDALWHYGPAGAGFELTESHEAWIWQADQGGLLHEIAFDPTGKRALLAHDQGILLADESEVESSSVAEFDTDTPAFAAVYGAQHWYVLTADDDQWSLLQFTDDLSLNATRVLDIQRPSTVLGYELAFDGALYLEVEGLLSKQYYVAASPSSGNFTSTTEAMWPSGGNVNTTTLPEFCTGIADVAMSPTTHWCTHAEGLARWNASTLELESLRFPIVSQAQGFGQFPQMFLAFGGLNSTVAVDAGDVLVSNRMEDLNFSENQSLSVKGILPYAYGNDSAVDLTYAGFYGVMPGFEQLGELDAVVLGFISLNDAELLALAEADERSILLISSMSNSTDSGTMESLRDWFDERSTMDDLFLVASPVKVQAAQQAEQSSGLLSAMFLVFGTFTIAAGVLLSLTIIMLLADVRRSELAVVRALGLRRSDARALFVQEGLILALFAGGIGSLVGLGLAWVISRAFSTIFASAGAQSFSFSWSVDSFAAGWIWGTLLAVALLWSASVFNSQVNIVRALKGGRLTLKTGVPWGLYLLQVGALGGGILSLAGLVFLGFDSGIAYVAYVSLGAFLILLLTPVVTWQLPVILGSKQPWKRWKRHGPRNTLGAIGLLFLLWTIALAPVDPIRSRLEANELAFIVLGLLQVISGVMVLTSLAPLLVQTLSKSRAITRRIGPVGSVALAHPLAHPIRTAVVMGMFSITMFSVVVLSGYTDQFDTYSSDFVEEAEGEFELLLTASRSRPIDLDSNTSLWGVNDSAMKNIDAVGGVYRSPIHLQDSDGERMPYVLRGVDEGFRNHGGLPLHVWDEALGETQKEAWKSVERFDNIVFLDASFGLESTTDGATIVPLQFSIGDSILLIDFSNPKNTREVQVGGFLEQSSYIFSPGVWMSSTTVDEQFGGEMTRMYVSVATDAEASTAKFSSMDASPQGKSTEERQAAAELADVLSRNLASQGVSVQTVAEEIAIIQSLVLAILSLFEGYLAMGLLVGVAGIGVVTVRNVSERRRTIGMLRAIGLRQRQVLAIFFIEVSWIAMLGMLNGLLLGYGFHRALYQAIWESEGAAFTFPWTSTLLLFLLGWVIVFLTTYLPVKQASKIPPSAALRDS
jgi:putative ABC transport system permease protein